MGEEEKMKAKMKEQLKEAMKSAKFENNDPIEPKDADERFEWALRKIQQYLEKKEKEDVFRLDDEGNVIFGRSNSKTGREERTEEGLEQQELILEILASGEVPDEMLGMFAPPEDIATYPGYPNIDGLGEEDANEAINTFLV